MIPELIKSFLGGSNYEFKKISADYLLKQKSKMNTEKYVRWLRKKSVFYGAIITMQKEKGLSIPQFWIDGFKSIEDEREEMEKIISQKIPQELSVRKNSPAKKIYAIFIIIAVIILGLLSLNYYGNILDRQSHTYADEAIPVIVNSWDYKELMSRANSELLSTFSEDDIKSELKTSSDKLGRLKKYEGSNGQVHIHTEIFCKNGMMCTIITAEYTAKAVFEKGEATIIIKMVHQNFEWKIYKFLVYSIKLSQIEENTNSLYLNNISEAKKYYQEKKYNESIQSAEKALLDAVTNEEKTEAHFRMGLSYYKLSDIKAAEEEYQKAIIIDPDHVPSHSSMTSVYNSYGKFEDAVKSAKKAISIDFEYSWAHSNLGVAYSNLGKSTEAIQEFRTAISIASDVPDFHYNLAITYNNKNKIEESINEYEKTIEIDPKFEGAYNNLGNIYNDQGEYDKAAEIYKKGIENVFDSSILHHALAKVYYQMQNHEEQEKEMKLTLKYDKYHTASYFGLFDYYVKFNQFEDLKLLLIKYLTITGKSKEQVKNEITNTDWIENKEEIIKKLEEIPQYK